MLPRSQRPGLSRSGDEEVGRSDVARRAGHVPRNDCGRSRRQLDGMYRVLTVPDIYILHGSGAAEQALASTLAADFGGLQATPVLMTADELVARYKQRAHLPVVGPYTGILPGTMIALLSETMLGDVDRCAALLATVAGTSILDFRHYFICVGISPKEVIDRFPDIAQIYENVMLRTESDLRSVIEDVKHNFSQRIPGFWDSGGRVGIKLILGTLVALVLSRVSRIYSLRLPLAGALAVLLYMQTSRALTVALLLVCFYTVGLGLSRIDPLDLWPWLGRRWKWSVSLDPLHSLHASPLDIGPIVVAGAISGVTAAMIMGDWIPFAIGFTSGLVLQMLTNAACVFNGLGRLRQARASYPADILEDETACDPDQLREAIRSCLILRNFNLTVVFGSLLVVSFVSVVGAAHFPWSLAFAWLAAYALGTLTPTVIAISWLAGDLSLMRVHGLTNMHLRRTGEVYRQVGWAKMPYPLGIDDASLATFGDHEKEELTRFAFLKRIPTRWWLRGWFTPRDFAFISYVWTDEKKLNTAECLDKTLGEIGIPSFRDTRAIQDPFAAWREYIAPALMRCTHYFIIVTPGIKNGKIVFSEIETVVQRWHLEMLPAVICVVDPKDARVLRDDHQVPLQLRFLLTCCPQMTLSEAADPRRVRYIVEHTRRQGKWNDWLTMLSPCAATHRILRMPGIVHSAETRSAPDPHPTRGQEG